MARVISAIGSCRDGTIEFMLAEERKPTECFIFRMTPDDAVRLSNKLTQAAYNARRGIENYDIPGDDARMGEVSGEKRRQSREKFRVCYGQKSDNNKY